MPLNVNINQAMECWSWCYNPATCEEGREIFHFKSNTWCGGQQAQENIYAICDYKAISNSQYFPNLLIEYLLGLHVV